jgi:NADPH:quinone reductase-like Zn-dependent oxidoreductase
MNAIVQTRYGRPQAVLELRDLPVPEPGPGQVRVRVAYAAVNDWDWSMVRGRPLPYRLLFGPTGPRHPVPGMELSGTVEALGPGVRRFREGDRVYGDTSAHGFGAWAERACFPETALVPMPPGMPFDVAAALPHAALLAAQAFGPGGPRPGQHVLINGAGGGVGTLGGQLALAAGARVTGVDTGPKRTALERLGFGDVIDFRETDFARTGERYDLILDNKATRPPRAIRRALAPGGRYVVIGGDLTRIAQFAAFGGKAMSVLALKANQGLDAIGAAWAEGRLAPLIDGPWPLAEAAAALTRFGEGRHAGKVLLSLAP